MKKAPSNKELHDLADALEARIRTLEGEARQHRGAQVDLNNRVSQLGARVLDLETAVDLLGQGDE